MSLDLSSDQLSDKVLSSAVSTIAHSSESSDFRRPDSKKFDYVPSWESLKLEARDPLQSSHHATFLNVSEKMLLDHELVDVKIYCQGVEFSAHKFLLAVFSPYFRETLFSGKDKVEIDFIQPRIFVIILKFFYTGRLPIRASDEQILKELIESSVTLQVSVIYFHCLLLLLHRPSRQQFVLGWNIIDGYNSRNITRSYLEYFINHIYFLKDTEGFRNLSLRRLIILLKFPKSHPQSEDEQRKRNEDDLFDCLLSWLKKDSKVRKKHIENLTHYIQFDALSKEYMMNLLETEDFIKTDSFTAKCLITALQKQNARFSKTLDDKLCFGDSEHQLKWEFGKPSMNVIFAADSCDTSVVESNPSSGQTSPDQLVMNLEQNPIRYQEDVDHKTTVITKFKRETVLTEKVICVYGSCKFRSKPTTFVQKFFFSKKQHWVMLQSHPNDYHHKMATCSHCRLIFYCGGQHIVNQSVTNAFWSFNYVTNTWRPLKPMCHKRADACLIGLNGYLYAVGGNTFAKVLDSVEKYNIQEDCWIPMASLPHPVSNPVATVMNENIWISDKKQLLIYQPFNNKWLVEASLPREIIAVDAVISSKDRKLYLIPKLCSKSVYEYCEESQVWSKCLIPIQISGECYSMFLSEEAKEYFFFVLTTEAIYKYTPPCTWEVIDDMTQRMESLGAVLLEIVPKS